MDMKEVPLMDKEDVAYMHTKGLSHKKSEIMTFSAKQMDTENITREISQIQQCMLPFTCLWNLKKII